MREDGTHPEPVRLPIRSSPPSGSRRLRSESPGCPPALLSSKVEIKEKLPDRKI
ncbi:similar to small EDRK-rich factor 1 (predicted), isoform CRA_b [Rattus norvegicus]|uniref:Similar to small EDRK-rich factor 1 (Predicted), isoform CRA_b n=1 Tax=Rattus norvegicus TaxID=10116 RepID=A6I583_RAT|nr:similar to small EDRK-rich factor 1 (predicted), isoform CRA_b [Rattus norvegicus]